MKKELLQLLIIFIIFIIVSIGSLSIYKQYEQKVQEIKYSQNLVLKHVNKELNKLITKVESLANYLILNYDLNKKMLETLVKTQEAIFSAIILDKNGIVQDYYTRKNFNIYKGFDYSTKRYFKELKNKKSYWSEVYISSVENRPTISYSLKTEDKILVFHVDLLEFSNFLNRFKNYDESFMIKIFDKNGILIIDPYVDRMLVEGYNAAPSEIFTKLISKAKPFEQVIYKGLKTNTTQLGSYFKVEKLNWNVVVRIEHNYILKSLFEMFAFYILIIIISIVVSIYVTLKITKNLFLSFDEMHILTSSIANGNYNIKVKESEYAEFNTLLESFHSMRSQINKREISLQKSLSSFKSLFNSTMESIILSENGKIIDVNDISLKIFCAKSKESFINKSMSDIINLKYCESEDKDLPQEVEIQKHDGLKMHALVQTKSLELKGKMINVTAVIDISELKEKDKLLFHQSKMASLGEMIGNIAHQWRQPLSLISTCASGLKLEKEFNKKIEDKHFDNTMDLIVDNTKYLSKTIDDFRNYFKINENKKEFSLKNAINSALILLDASLKNNEVVLKKTFLDENLNYHGSSNELVQVLINIINNSNDVFKTRNLEDKYIYLEEKIENDIYQIIIQDNAGGIQENIIQKIFEPYFTTKHQSQGTGLGLYMAHQIIHDHFNGTITVTNSYFDVEGKKEKGANFKIELPL